MTDDEAREMWRDLISANGEDISIRRYLSTGLNPTTVDRPCRARITGGTQQSDLVGAITQNNLKVLVLAEDLAGESPPFVPTKSDKVIAGRFPGEIAILAVDDSTHRNGPTLIAYEFTVRG